MRKFKLARLTLATAMISPLILVSQSIVSEAVGGTASGWVAGLGAEYAFQNNWSAKLEYNVFGFGNDSGTFGTFNGNSVTLQTVKAGVNYRFGGWPLVSR